MNLDTIKEIKNQFVGKYFIYDRKSTDDANNQRNSLQYQREHNLAFAKREKLALADLTITGFCKNGIIDESHSAFKEEDEFVILPDGTTQYRMLRKKFASLTMLLKDKKLKGVIFLNLDRATRNDHDKMLIAKLANLGADIRFAETTYENNSFGQAHMDIDAAFAKMHSKKTSEGVIKANVKLRDEGIVIYPSPIGYLDKVGAGIKPKDPVRAPIVKRIFELYATGEWSFQSLALWAEKQGLTKKPHRRLRTKEEMADNVDLEDIPQVARPVDKKTIEGILGNPFYTGKFKYAKGEGRFDGEWRPSVSHEPLIDDALFNKVQKMMRSKNQSLHYEDAMFFPYRKLLRCACGRLYTPYRNIPKNLVYYGSKCLPHCENTCPHVRDIKVDEELQAVLERIYFSNAELAAMEADSKKELDVMATRKDRVREDAQIRRRKIAADLDYLEQNKLTLLREGAMDPAGVKSEKERLQGLLATIEEEVPSDEVSPREMLEVVLKFSELAKNVVLYHRFALDEQKREIVMRVFSELTLMDEHLIDYKAKEGFHALLRRHANFCARERT